MINEFDLSDIGLFSKRLDIALKKKINETGDKSVENIQCTQW